MVCGSVGPGGRGAQLHLPAPRCPRCPRQPCLPHPLSRCLHAPGEALDSRDSPPGPFCSPYSSQHGRTPACLLGGGQGPRHLHPPHLGGLQAPGPQTHLVVRPLSPIWPRRRVCHSSGPGCVCSSKSCLAQRDVFRMNLCHCTWFPLVPPSTT